MEIIIGLTAGLGLEDTQVLPLASDPTRGNSYSFMTGNSPFFSTVPKLLAYFDGLPLHMKDKHFNMVDGDRHLVIYQHQVSRVDQELPHSYKAKKGEILSTDEYYFYNFDTRKWHWEEGFQR
jgi:hypothetical protein